MEHKQSCIYKKKFYYFNKLDFEVGLLSLYAYAIGKKYHIIRGEINTVLIKKNLDIMQVKEENIIFNNSEIDVLADFYVSAKMELAEKRIVFMFTIILDLMKMSSPSF